MSTAIALDENEKLESGLTIAVFVDPVESAKAAGLRYVTDDEPGVRRRKRGKGFTYLDAQGRTIRDPRQLERIRKLAIPPAWTDVWICARPNGHLQATGRDARGRKQYRYHADWRQVRDETKFGRMMAFGKSLPLIRERIERDLSLPGLRREKVLAAVVRLLETTLIRIGNKEYARQNNSFGLTTLRDQHVDVSGARLRFEFRGKSGKEHSVEIQDRRLARIVKQCRDLPASKAVVEAIKRVAGELGNRPAICRKYYVHPAVIDAFLEGSLPQAPAGAGEPGGLRALEAQVLELLKERNGNGK
jgi:DNA topoisomerase IB